MRRSLVRIIRPTDLLPDADLSAVTNLFHHLGGPPTRWNPTEQPQANLRSDAIQLNRAIDLTRRRYLGRTWMETTRYVRFTPVFRCAQGRTTQETGQAGFPGLSSASTARGVPDSGITS